MNNYCSIYYFNLKPLFFKLIHDYYNIFLKYIYKYHNLVLDNIDQ